LTHLLAITSLANIADESSGSEGLMTDLSEFSIPISACNDSTASPFIARNGNHTIMHSWFEKTWAEFKWEGQFDSEFDAGAIRQYNSSSYAKSGSGNGTFTIRFKGNVDPEHSHTMLFGMGNEVN
jgi:hypothetical protein